MSIKFTVYGTPQPKGSTQSFIVNDKVVTTSANRNLKSWQGLTSLIAQENRPAELIKGPVEVNLAFFFSRPKSISIKKRPLPIVKPDIDKITRAILDALTGIFFADDSQVVTCNAAKRYEDTPRVEISVTEIWIGESK